MSYTLEGLRDLARSIADDVSSATSNKSAVLLHSDDRLDQMANEAQRQACRRHRLIYDESTLGICKINLLAGVREYKLDKRITFIDDILYDDQLLVKYSMEDQNSMDSGWRSRTGAPSAYVQRGYTLYLSPTPTSNEDGEELTLCVFRLPLKDMVADSDEPEIAPEWHYDLVYWMLWEMFSSRDAEANNEKIAAKYRDLFDASFGKPISAGARTNQLSTPRGSRIAPASYSIR